METSVKNIAALLGSLARLLDISTIDHRKVIQKTVYLGQALGLPTNYQFSWYKYGPYSSQLADDYYALHSFFSRGEAIDPYRLSDNFEIIATRLRQLFDQKPAGQSEADWAELLASVLFLAKESRATDPKAIIEKTKHHLVQQFDAAKSTLQRASLL